MKTTTKAIALAVCIGLTCGAADAATKKKSKAKAQPCVSEAAMSELAFRQMQSELMTSALACGPAFRDAYTGVVQSGQPELAQHGSALKRALGSRTDRFVTQAANASARTLDCSLALAVYERLAQGETLSVVATEPRFREMTGYRVCQTKVARK